MAYAVTDTVAGTQGIATTSTTQKHPLGTIVRAKDSTYGEGEFIYLQGIGSTAIGSIVEYSSAFVTGLATVALETPQPLAVAMSANVASQYGWYQIGGQAVMKKTATVSFAADALVGAGAGYAIAVVTGLVIQGALVAVVASAATGVTSVRVMINRPIMTDKIDET